MDDPAGRTGQAHQIGLIDVVVAEVSLKGTDKLGIDWGFRENGLAQPNAGGVIRSATAGAAGLDINFLNSAGLIRAG